MTEQREGAPAEYVYAVYADYHEPPILYRAKVVKTTANRITTEPTGFAFHCQTRHKATAGYLHRTPKAAWDGYLLTLRHDISRAKAEIRDARDAFQRVTVKCLERPAIESTRNGGHDA